MSRSSNLYIDTISLLKKLENFILDLENKVIQEDQFTLENLTILTNSCIVLSCTYLESYIRDAFIQSIDLINQKLSHYNILDNVIRWAIIPDPTKINLENNIDKFLSIDKSSKSTYAKFIDEVSSKPEKTIKAFLILGIKLHNEPQFTNYIEEIGNFVEIRNLIVHRNEQHSLTLGDICRKIELIISYLKFLDDLLLERDYLSISESSS